MTAPECCAKARNLDAIFDGDMGRINGWSDYQEHPDAKWCIIGEIDEDCWSDSEGNQDSCKRALYLPIQYCPFCGTFLIS